MSNNISQIKFKPVAHIYAFALFWFIFITLGSPSPNIVDITAIALLSLGCSSIVWVIGLVIRLIAKIFNKHLPDVTSTTSEAASHIIEGPQSVDSKEINESLILLAELERNVKKIESQEISTKSNDIIQLSKGILEKVNDKPELIQSVRRFFNYYLPTTNKLIIDYHKLERQVVKSENIVTSISKIDTALDMLKNAFEKQLDNLYSQTTINLETDLDVLENILKSEGLLLPEDQKNYLKQV